MLAGANDQAALDGKHQHLQMHHILVPMRQAEGFSAKAAVQTPSAVHLHL